MDPAATLALMALEQQTLVYQLGMGGKLLDGGLLVASQGHMAADETGGGPQNGWDPVKRDVNSKIPPLHCFEW